MRILMRASQGPFDNYDPLNTLVFDRTWNNSGNLLFPYSIISNILTENITIETCSRIPSPTEADAINEKYDMLLLPFANAFRPTFVNQLRRWTDLINAVKIPCVVVGVGAQCGLDFSSQTKFDFDDDVKDFCAAVASKSASIGVRGELTYEYLKRLGFGSVTRVIGCPSMYMFGAELPPLKSKKHGLCRSKLKTISVNSKNNDSDEVKRFLFNEENNYIFISQENIDYGIVYSGMPRDEKADGFYPLNINNKVFMNDRARFCINVPSWLKLLQSVDFSIGTRIHGNIAAVLAGTPTFIIATDSRVIELARYHNIPHKTPKELDFSKSIKDIYRETDFTTVYKGHKERYKNFADFLRVNGLTPIEQPNAYFDGKINAIDYHEPVRNILKVSDEEAAQRLNGYLAHLQRKINNQNKTINDLRKEKQALEAALKNSQA